MNVRRAPAHLIQQSLTGPIDQAMLLEAVSTATSSIGALSHIEKHSAHLGIIERQLKLIADYAKTNKANKANPIIETAKSLDGVLQKLDSEITPDNAPMAENLFDAINTVIAYAGVYAAQLQHSAAQPAQAKAQPEEAVILDLPSTSDAPSITEADADLAAMMGVHAPKTAERATYVSDDLAGLAATPIGRESGAIPLEEAVSSRIVARLKNLVAGDTPAKAQPQPPIAYASITGDDVAKQTIIIKPSVSAPAEIAQPESVITKAPIAENTTPFFEQSLKEQLASIEALKAALLSVETSDKRLKNNLTAIADLALSDMSSALKADYDVENRVRDAQQKIKTRVAKINSTAAYLDPLPQDIQILLDRASAIASARKAIAVKAEAAPAVAAPAPAASVETIAEPTVSTHPVIENAATAITEAHIDAAVDTALAVTDGPIVSSATKNLVQNLLGDLDTAVKEKMLAKAPFEILNDVRDQLLKAAFDTDYMQTMLGYNEPDRQNFQDAIAHMEAFDYDARNAALTEVQEFEKAAEALVSQLSILQASANAFIDSVKHAPKDSDLANTETFLIKRELIDIKESIEAYATVDALKGRLDTHFAPAPDDTDAQRAQLATSLDDMAKELRVSFGDLPPYGAYHKIARALPQSALKPLLTAHAFAAKLPAEDRQQIFPDIIRAAMEHDRRFDQPDAETLAPPPLDNFTIEKLENAQDVTAYLKQKGGYLSLNELRAIGQMIGEKPNNFKVIEPAKRVVAEADIDFGSALADTSPPSLVRQNHDDPELQALTTSVLTAHKQAINIIKILKEHPAGSVADLNVITVRLQDGLIRLSPQLLSTYAPNRYAQISIAKTLDNGFAPILKEANDIKKHHVTGQHPAFPNRHAPASEVTVEQIDVLNDAVKDMQAKRDIYFASIKRREQKLIDDAKRAEESRLRQARFAQEFSDAPALQAEHAKKAAEMAKRLRKEKEELNALKAFTAENDRIHAENLRIQAEIDAANAAEAAARANQKSIATPPPLPALREDPAITEFQKRLTPALDILAQHGALEPEERGYYKTAAKDLSDANIDIVDTLDYLDSFMAKVEWVRDQRAPSENDNTVLLAVEANWHALRGKYWPYPIVERVQDTARVDAAIADINDETNKAVAKTEIVAFHDSITPALDVLAAHGASEQDILNFSLAASNVPDSGDAVNGLDQLDAMYERAGKLQASGQCTPEQQWALYGFQKAFFDMRQKYTARQDQPAQTDPAARGQVREVKYIGPRDQDADVPPLPPSDTNTNPEHAPKNPSLLARLAGSAKKNIARPLARNAITNGTANNEGAPKDAIIAKTPQDKPAAKTPSIIVTPKDRLILPTPTDAPVVKTLLPKAPAKAAPVSRDEPKNNVVPAALKDVPVSKDSPALIRSAQNLRHPQNDEVSPQDPVARLLPGQSQSTTDAKRLKNRSAPKAKSDSNADVELPQKRRSQFQRGQRAQNNTRTPVSREPRIGQKLGNKLLGFFLNEPAHLRDESLNWRQRVSASWPAAAFKLGGMMTTGTLSAVGATSKLALIATAFAPVAGIVPIVLAGAVIGGTVGYIAHRLTKQYWDLRSEAQENGNVNSTYSAANRKSRNERNAHFKTSEKRLSRRWADFRAAASPAEERDTWLGVAMARFAAKELSEKFPSKAQLKSFFEKDRRNQILTNIGIGASVSLLVRGSIALGMYATTGDSSSAWSMLAPESKTPALPKDTSSLLDKPVIAPVPTDTGSIMPKTTLAPAPVAPDTLAAADKPELKPTAQPGDEAQRRLDEMERDARIRNGEPKRIKTLPIKTDPQTGQITSDGRAPAAAPAQPAPGAQQTPSASGAKPNVPAPAQQTAPAAASQPEHVARPRGVRPARPGVFDQPHGARPQGVRPQGNITHPTRSGAPHVPFRAPAVPVEMVSPAQQMADALNADGTKNAWVEPGGPDKGRVKFTYAHGNDQTVHVVPLPGERGPLDTIRDAVSGGTGKIKGMFGGLMNGSADVTTSRAVEPHMISGRIPTPPIPRMN